MRWATFPMPTMPAQQQNEGRRYSWENNKVRSRSCQVWDCARRVLQPTIASPFHYVSRKSMDNRR